MARFWFEKYKTYLVTLPLAMVGHFEVALFVFELQIPEVHLAPKVSRHNSLNKRFYMRWHLFISLDTAPGHGECLTNCQTDLPVQSHTAHEILRIGECEKAGTSFYVPQTHLSR